LPDGALEPICVVEGAVEHGDERGRLLGFPTANLIDTTAVRLDGVYAGLARVDPDRGGPALVTAVSVGHRPTYYRGDALRLLEAHLLDFDGDLYGKTLRVELHVRLRPQHAYVDTPTLVRQLHLDVDATRAWARANALDELLPADRPPDRPQQKRWSDGRTTFARRRGPARADIAAQRAGRREGRLLEAIEQAAAEGVLTHERVVELSGLPMGYVLWRYPAQRDLRASRSRHAG
jgi:hypothetical protein